MITVAHKRGDCIGCLLCHEVAPHYWQINADGLAQLVQISHAEGPYEIAQAFQDDLPALVEAATHCPVNLITIRRQAPAVAKA